VSGNKSERKTTWHVDGRAFGARFVTRLSARTMRSAETIDWHRHEQLEILGCLKGSLAYEFSRRATVTLKSGHFLVIPPGVRHRIASGVTGPARRFSIFLASPDSATRRASTFTPADFRDLTARLLAQRFSPRAMPPREYPHVMRLADLIECEGNCSPQDILRLRTILGFLLVEFADAKPPRPDTSVDRLMASAENWLEEHLAGKIRMDDLVTHIGYGRSRFFALFKAHTGLTPVEWITRRRIDLSKKLLADSSLPITEVAHRSGFSTGIFYTRVFRRYVGQTPTAWRNTLTR